MYFEEAIFESPELLLCLTVLLSIYLLRKVYVTFKSHGYLAFIHPPVIATISHFLVGYVVPNVMYYLDTDWSHMTSYLGTDAQVYTWLNYATLLVSLSAVAMWHGYDGAIGLSMAHYSRKFFSRMTFLKTQDTVGLFGITTLLAIGFAAPLIRINLGIFGFFYTQQTVDDSINYRQWLGLLDDIGYLGLLLVSLSVFGKRLPNSHAADFILVASLSFYVVIGFLSGVKSQMVIPFIISGVACYVMTHRIPKTIIITGVVMLIASYPFVTPLRRRCLTDSEINIRSVSSVVSTGVSSFFDTISQDGYYTKEDDFSVLGLISRQDLIIFTAISMKFAENELSAENQSMFRNNILLSVPIAIVPRFLWKTKPLNNTSTWYNINVLGAPSDSKTAVGMGPASYLFFAGHIAAVFAGFWIMGVIQKIISFTFARGQIGSWVVYFGMLGPLTSMNSDVGAAYAGLIRVFPCLLLAQFIMSFATVRSSRT
ncbi:MAG: hypothetical protein ABL921_26915 [Pirellula sp.]